MRRLERTVALSLAVLTISVVSTAAPAPGKKPQKPSEPEPLPPAQVTLKVVPGTASAPWRLQIENVGEEPFLIPADPALLVLDLTPAPGSVDEKKKKTPASPTATRCILPDDARPSTDEGRDLVIPSKRSWSASFDPLFYCFGARERALLVSGTSVTAHFGWPPRAAGKGTKPVTPTPPFAVAPVGASVGKVAPLKALEATPFTLSDAVLTAPTDADTAGKVSLSVPEAMDVARGAELTTSVALTNGTDRPITLLFRPNMLQFSVSGRNGNVSCGTPQTVAAPIRELFVTVPVKGEVETSVLFTTTCPAETFDEPGIYRVLPRLDATNASGGSLGMKTWDGVAVGKAPLLLRVRTPRKPAPFARPTLD